MRASQMLRLFPGRWRERYGEEFLATAGSGHLRLTQVIDIAVCAVDAWFSPEVRRATRAARVELVLGEKPMSKQLVTTCGRLDLQRRDAVLGALAMIGGSLLFTAAGIVLNRSGYEDLGEGILGMAFFAALLLSMPFTYLKGRCWQTQLALVGLPLLILVLIAVCAGLLANRI